MSNKRNNNHIKKVKKSRIVRTNNIHNNITNNTKIVKKIIKQLKVRMIDDPIEKSIKYYIESIGNISKKDNSYYMNNKEIRERLFLNYIRHNYCNYTQLVKKLDLFSVNEKEQFKNDINEIILKKYKGII